MADVCQGEHRSPVRRERKCDAPWTAEFPIRFSPSQRRKAAARFHCGTALYNACLSEAINRALAMRADPRWSKARMLPRIVDGVANAERRDLFNSAQADAGFSAWDLMSVASRLRVGWLREGVPAQEATTLGERAFRAVERWVRHFGGGRKGRPRFKSLDRGIRSMSSRDQNGAIRVVELCDDRTGDFAGFGCQWTAGFMAPVDSRDNPVHRHAEAAIRNGMARYSTIVRRKISGRWYYYLQVSINGQPLQRHQVGEGKVGLDLGTSTVAVVSDHMVGLERLCDGLENSEAELRRVHRRLDRQHRAGSPTCFDDHGLHRKGSCAWTRSRRAEQTVISMQEAHRRKAERRKSLHGNLANRILGQGRDLYVERLSKQTWQKTHGRAVAFRAPGMFETLLSRKAVSAGGSTTLIDPRKAKLSRLCSCGSVRKKPLSQRAHDCPCGIREQRDIWSAFLARHTTASGAVALGAAQIELSQRHDVGAGRGAIAPNLQVPTACLMVPEYASGRAGRLAGETKRVDIDIVGEARGGPKNQGRTRP